MKLQTTTIFNKLENLEKAIQRLKLEMFFALPKIEQKTIYPEQRLIKAVRSARKSIWKDYYAKKV